MPYFLIERNYAVDVEPHFGAFDEINRINDAEGVRWLYSFLSADKRKTFCLYEAPSADVVRRAAVAAGLPADVVVEVTGTVTPDGALASL